MRKALVAGAVAAIASGQAAAEPSNLAGLWLTENGDSKIRISPCGKAFCGTVVWAKTNGSDEHNPDLALRKRSIIGMPLTRDMKPDRDGGWSGSIYNPQNGKTYSVTMQVRRGRELDVEGCVLGVLCGSDRWSRLPEETASANSAGATQR